MSATLPEVTISEARGVRYLHLGTPWIQGAMRLEAPLELELEYVQRMMAWMLFRAEGDVTRGHAVQLGLGAAAITRFCAVRLRMRTTAVEINPQVVAACRRWFRLPEESARLAVVTGNAADFAADPRRRESADVLTVDLYDHEAASPALDSAAFYRDCHALLAAGGVMTVNLFGRDASFERSIGRIAAAFGAGSVLHLKPTREGNTVVIAMKQVTPAASDVLARRVENIETRWSLPARKWLRMMRACPAAVPKPHSNAPDAPPA